MVAREASRSVTTEDSFDQREHSKTRELRAVGLASQGRGCIRGQQARYRPTRETEGASWFTLGVAAGCPELKETEYSGPQDFSEFVTECVSDGGGDDDEAHFFVD